MHPALESFMQRPTSHKLGVFFGTLLFIAYIFWQFFYKDKLDERQAIEQSIEQLNVSIATEQRIARNLVSFQKEVAALEIKLKAALLELPDKREIPDLLTSISNLARDAGLEVGLFKPLPPVNKEFYEEVPVSVSVEGTFHQVATFFDEVAQLPRIVNINQIALKDPKVTEEKVTIKSDCVATTFRYVEESERIKTKETGQERRRRK